MSKRYAVFHRTWWKRNKHRSGKLEPKVGKSHLIAYAFTAEEARQIAKHWNGLREAGPLSDRAEWGEVT